MGLDQTTRVMELRELVQRFVQERGWEQYHTPKNLTLSIAIEAAEIMERFQWMSEEGSRESLQDREQIESLGDELADVIIYCLALANQMEIDVSAAVRSKLSRNEDRFPIGHMPT